MKRVNKLIIIIFSVSFIWMSCSEEKKIKRQSTAKIIATQDLNKIKKKKTEVKNRYDKLREELTLLNEEIEKLDTIEKLPLVTVLNVKSTFFKHFLELQGSVETNENVIIYPEFSGILSTIYVKEGQPVKKEQLLAKIDDGGLSNQLGQLKVQYQLSKTTYERQKRLWNQKIGSEMQYLQAESNMKAQEEGIAVMKDRLEKTYVRAPFSGIIDDVITERGSVVAPRSELFKLVNLDKMYVRSDVPEIYLPNIKIGTSVEVYLPVLGKKIEAQISRMSHTIDKDNRTFSIEIEIPNKDGQLKPNLTARLKINDYTNEKAILVPESIISENAEGEQYVYIAQQSSGKERAKALKRMIKTGLSQDGKVEITSGLKEGDRIIDEGARNVKPGLRIEIKKL